MAKKIYEWPYYLIENTVTTEEGDYIAKVKTKKTKTVEDIADLIVKERTEYRRDTIVNILQMANKAKTELITGGNSVNDGLAIYEPGITGNFYENTAFDEARNACVVNTRITAELYKLLPLVKGAYNGLTLDNGGASIDGVVDATTGATDGTVTSGKVITIRGSKIRLVPEEGETLESCIVYTRAGTSQTVAQTEPPVINDPSKIVLQLPVFSPVGSYTLTIKTLYSNSAVKLKEPRYITFKTTLSVV